MGAPLRRIEDVERGDLIAGQDEVRDIVYHPTWISLICRNAVNGVHTIRSFDRGTMVPVLEHWGRCTGCDRPRGVDCHEQCPN